MIMRKPLMLALALALSLSVAGCSSMEKLTGMGRDDTVLPGSREDAIPGKTQFPDASDTMKPGTSTGDSETQQDIATQDLSGQQPDAAVTATPSTPPKPCKPTDQKCKLAAAHAAKSAGADAAASTAAPSAGSDALEPVDTSAAAAPCKPTDQKCKLAAAKAAAAQKSSTGEDIFSDPQ